MASHKAMVEVASNLEEIEGVTVNMSMAKMGSIGFSCKEVTRLDEILKMAESHHDGTVKLLSGKTNTFSLFLK